MGWDGYERSLARDVQFRSNLIKGAGFGINATDQDHDFSVYWTLEVLVLDQEGKAVEGKEVVILDRNGDEVFREVTAAEGKIIQELPAYSFASHQTVFSSPYTVTVGKKKQKVDLTENSRITFVSRQ
jgi:hypothetical protein